MTSNGLLIKYEDIKLNNADQYSTTPSEGLTLTWSDLNVKIKSSESSFFKWKKKYHYKHIINNVSGSVLPGELVGLMGPSGAGKSTLLAALGYRYQGGMVVSGDIRVNGYKTDESVRNISEYMYQEDFFMSSLTVTEHLRFMARLKMDRRMPKREMEIKILELIAKLGLKDVANSKIGGMAINNEKAILSGGEKKRLSFATTCLTSPKLIFVDEPTTGLDSYSAARLIEMMSSIAKSTGTSILSTIHQPSPDILKMFSKVLLIADGRLIFGGKTEEAVNFFHRCGFQIHNQMSHGEFMLKCLSPKPGEESQTHFFLKDLSEKYYTSREYQILKKEISDKKEIDIPKTYNYDVKKPFWIVRLFWLILRGTLEELRNPSLQWIRIFQKLLVAIAAGLCYLGTLELNQDGIQGVQGVLFILVTENTFAPMYAVMALFPLEFPLFIREHSNGSYQPSAYYLSKIIYTLPGLVFESIMFTSCVYLMAGLRPTLYAFLMINLFTILCINVAAACGTFFSIAFPTIPTAMTYLVPFEYAAMMTSGLFLKLSTIPVYAAWLKYVSWFMYTYESMSVLQWENVQNITCMVKTLGCLSTGQEVLESYSFSEDNLLRNTFGLLGLYLCFHILGYIFFVKRIRKEIY